MSSGQNLGPQQHVSSGNSALSGLRASTAHLSTEQLKQLHDQIGLEAAHHAVQLGLGESRPVGLESGAGMGSSHLGMLPSQHVPVNSGLSSGIAGMNLGAQDHGIVPGLGSTAHSIAPASTGIGLPNQQVLV